MLFFIVTTAALGVINLLSLIFTSKYPKKSLLMIM